jgi:hypothetical protein
LKGATFSNDQEDGRAVHVLRRISRGADETRARPLNRNSIDNHGMTMMPSIHYGVQFNNAQWNPAAQHCLAPQPTPYSQMTPGMDPHFSSGPPNLVFCTA